MWKETFLGVCVLGLAFSSAPRAEQTSFRSSILASAAETQPKPATAESASATAKPQATSFSFQTVIAQARALAKTAYVPPDSSASQAAAGLDYDQYRRIEFKRDASDWLDPPNNLVHTHFDSAGYLFKQPVAINLVEGGKAHPRPFDQAEFNFFDLDLTDEEKSALGYAGFNLTTPLNAAGKYDAFISFKGASFFRALGMDNRWGASARGLALSTASSYGEEFPFFREFWLRRPGPGERSVIVYALLDSLSLAGAYRFVVSPGTQTTVEVSAHLFPRRDVTQAGVAPITSMFDLAPHDPAPSQKDFRPRVHDSEGLMIQMRSGEWIWRPLLNPQRLEVSSFTNEAPLGFGLIQRERRFSAYEDLEARYDLRPNVWVVPKGDWGAGQIVLVEIPTANEFNDNIVTFFRPTAPWKKDSEVRLAYTLYWGMDAPSMPAVVSVASTRVGNAVNSERPFFVLDFNTGGSVPIEEIKPEISASAGRIVHPLLIANPLSGGLRLTFELEPDGDDAAELRAVLTRAEQPISETWLYRWRLQ